MSWQVGAHPDDAPRPPAEPAPSVRHRSVSSQVVIRPRSDTREAVVLELLPLLPPALAYGATQVLVPWGWPLALAAFAVAAVAAFVVASRDRSALGMRGFVGIPPSALALLSPVLYLAVRGRVCRGHDRDAYAPLPWAIGATAVGILLFALLAWFEGQLDASMGGGDLSQLTSLLG